MTLRSLLLYTLFTFLVACNAYKAKPESAISFTRQDLTRKGFILAPIAVPDSKLNPGPAEVVAYDLILGNTLREKWKNVSMLSSGDIAKSLDTEQIEAWRTALGKEDQKEVSPSTLGVLKDLTKQGKSFPKQVLLPTLLQNTVSCGQKDAVSTYLSPDPHGQRKYCQRILKMRFRIMSVESSELLWNGLIYATQENAAEIDNDEDKTAASQKPELEAPTTQTLIRECFHNFAKQFSER